MKVRIVKFGLLVCAALWLSIFNYGAYGETNTPKLTWDRETTIKQLQKGGYILLIRHERTEVPSRQDDFSKEPTDCTAQRNLSIAGAAGAKETGVILRALKVDVQQVLTTPMCRGAETARHMFGSNYRLENGLMHHEPNGARTLDVAEQEARSLIQSLEFADANSNIALVSHGGTLFRVSGLRLSEGEVAVISVNNDGEIDVHAHFMGSDLGYYARVALAKGK